VSSDILADWKRNRFIVAGVDLHDFKNEHIVVLTDFAYWTLELDNLVEWCNNNNCTQEGMTVRIPNDRALTLFILRWT